VIAILYSPRRIAKKAIFCYHEVNTSVSMKKVIFLASCAMLLVFAAPVSAHFWQSAGPSTVLLHIVPDDDPIIGEPADLFFSFNNLAGTFDPSKYNFFISISDERGTLFTSNLSLIEGTKPTLFERHIPFTFSQKGVYTIILTAIPASSTLKEFNVQYQAQVDREKNTPPKKNYSHYGHIILLALVLIAIVVFYLSKAIKKLIVILKKP